MNGTATRFVRLGVSLAGLVTLGWVLTGQAARPARHAVALPTDWSHRHVIFTKPSSPEQLARVSEDPRYQQQINRREQLLRMPARMAEAGAAFGSNLRRPVATLRRPFKPSSKSLKRDWAEDLGGAASIGAANYPAKFSFNTNTASCDAATPPNQPDYVVFSTGEAGSVTQATVVAYDNLYSGCSGASVPMVYWAYNTGLLSTILTSPVLSLDGSQVAFVQSTGGSAFLVTLKWNAHDGSVATPSTPTIVTSMSLCPAATACMTLTPLTTSGLTPIDDQTSSVFYDYSNDIAWVGGTNSWLIKITGVFKGAPTEVVGGGFPVQLNPSNPNVLSSPVYDRISKNVFVGDFGGFLYSVNSATGAVTASSQLDFGAGLVDGPIVDSTNGLVYVFASADASFACAGGADCTAVYKLSTAFASGAAGTEVTIGNSVLFGTLPNPSPAYIGGFDSAYYDSTGVNSPTGNLYVCGNTGGSPTLYQVAITAGALPIQSLAIAPLAASNSTAACSPVTDIPNPNVQAPGIPSERAFVSVQNNGLPTVCAPGGCVLNFVTAPWTPNTFKALGQQILSPRGHVETVIVAGFSAANDASPWPNQAAQTYPDLQVTWIDQGVFGATYVTWQPSFHYVAPLTRIIDTNGNVEVLTTNASGDKTGTSQPAWNATLGGTTPDNTVVWTNVGPLGTAAMPVAGGTSGIIVDNTLGSGSIVGGSQVYFGTLGPACGADTCAVQASQVALQ